MARAAKAANADSSRLNVETWVNAALDLLAAEGIDNVLVQPLAQKLGVTKGSFYHHFKDRDALLLRMLEDWRRRATIQIIERIEGTHGTPRSRFEQLLMLPFSGPRSERGAEIELSIRLWARRDVRAKAALEEVDVLRLRYISRLLEECGVTAEESRARAVLAYSFIRVGSTLAPAKDTELLSRCQALLIGEETKKKKKK